VAARGPLTGGSTARLLPGLHRLQAYQRVWLRGDVLAGLSVAADFIPQVMGYAQVAGLRPVVGLWAIMGSLLVYAALGSSPQLSVGPESTTAIMTATAIAPLAAGDPDKYAAMAAALALVVGVLCAMAWVARLGFLADLLSKPVLVGYMTGIAAIMISGQLGKLTGAPSTVTRSPPSSGRSRVSPMRPTAQRSPCRSSCSRFSSPPAGSYRRRRYRSTARCLPPLQYRCCR
jgi:MFS superfamily sulfate permease-like transporter